MQIFSIDTNIYDEALISQAISDFSDFALIQFKNNSLLVDVDSQEKEVYLEFMNYLIWLYNQN